MQNESNEIKSRILDHYYANVYQLFLFGNGTQGKGIKYFEKQVERFWINKSPKRILEIGGGSGEHLEYVESMPLEDYTLLDIRPIVTQKHLDLLDEASRNKVKFVLGNAEDLPFDSDSFDRVFSTCLLHHVDDVLGVLLEARRVAKHDGGEIAFLLPTDPGFLNQMVKKLYSFRRIKKFTSIRPELIYALEHKNHVMGIIEQIRLVFTDDNLVFHYKPFGILKSWNLNLLVVAKITKQ
jgi:demethylmenaquinone methyltransferase/2-methoxy-6-polyprenyl-1,4-benzoquinol methylase